MSQSHRSVIAIANFASRATGRYFIWNTHRGESFARLRLTGESRAELVGSGDQTRQTIRLNTEALKNQIFAFSSKTEVFLSTQRKANPPHGNDPVLALFPKPQGQ